MTNCTFSLNVLSRIPVDLSLGEVSSDTVSAFGLTSVFTPGVGGGAADLSERKVDSDGESLMVFFGLQNTLLRGGQKTGGAVFSQRWEPEDQR